EVAVYIGAHGFVEAFIRDFFERVCVLLERGVVHQNIQLAKALYGVSYGIATERWVLYVTRDANGPSALGFDVAAGFFGVVVFIQINDRDVGTFACKKNRDCPAYARVAAGHDGGHATQLFTALIIGSQELGARVKVTFIAGLFKFLRRHGGLGILTGPGLRCAFALGVRILRIVAVLLVLYSTLLVGRLFRFLLVVVLFPGHLQLLKSRY